MDNDMRPAGINNKLDPVQGCSTVEELRDRRQIIQLEAIRTSPESGYSPRA
jgi:hypothetical protein